MISILFVCLGNICRSPMAEAVLKHLAKEEGIESKIRIDSAGIGNWHVGKPPHMGTIEELKKKGVPYDGLIARQLTKTDIEKFDLIIAMDRMNVTSIQKLTNTEVKNLYLLTEFASGLDQKGKDVPDPFHTQQFAETYRLIEECCRGLIDYIKIRLDEV